MIPRSVFALVDAYRRRQLSPVEVVDHFLERIDRLDDRLRAFLHVNQAEARAAARDAERAWQSPDTAPPLAGVPIAHKDNLHTADAPTTASSRLLAGRGPTFDADPVARLRAAGAVSLGKTNLSEFACGNMDLRGMPANPWKAGIYTGGSSGGSASAVAGGLVAAATGTDTAGSIRVPASFCGIVGVKPTFGLVSNRGLVPLSWTMDTVGPMTRSVRDAAILLEVMTAPSAARDASGEGTMVPSEQDDIRGLRVGVPRQHFFEGLAEPVEAAVQDAIRALETQGAQLVDLDLPLAGELAACGSVLVMSEAYAIHAHALRDRPQTYGSRTRRRIVAGGAYSTADLHMARLLARAWCGQLACAMATVDVLVTPTLPITAFDFDRQKNGPPDTSWGTRHFSLSGFPAMTVPCGLDADDLPIGVQIAARPFTEAILFRAAQAIERAGLFPHAYPMETDA